MPLKIRIADNEKTKELSENLTGGESGQQTLITYYHKDGKLVFVFDCDEDAPISYGDKDNDKIYKGDVVEVMITLGSRERYLEVSVNPSELKYVAIVDNRDGELTITPIAENPVETELIPTETGYIAKIILPKAWLEELGRTADTSYINFYRQDFNAVGDLRMYALSPTRTASFHKSEAFVPMEILE